MHRKNKYLSVLIILLITFVYSCKQDTGYFSIPKSIIDYQILINNNSVDANSADTIEYEDTTKLIFTFKENIDASDLVISFPANVVCDIYFNGEFFNSNKHEFIYNAEEIFLNNEKGIPISPENTFVKLLFNNKQKIKVGDEFVFIVFKSSYEIAKFKTINFYSKNDIYDTKELEVETVKYFAESKLPIVKINTSKILADSEYSYGELDVFNGNKINNLRNDTAEIETKLKIKIRGQSSKYYRKQSYKLTTLKTDSSNNNIELIGLPKENDWILYAPYWDESLIRNNLVYQLWADLGYYSPKTKYVELVLNNDYRGIYVLTEKIKIDKNRFNLNKLSKNDTSLADISGGYIFKIDKGKKTCWASKTVTNGYTRCYYYVSPTNKKMNNNQRMYIKNYVNDFENALLNDSNWQEYIDEQSFIDYLIVNELAKNIDSYRLSTYMSKDKNGKLKMGPIWDFDRAFGNEDKVNVNKFDGFIYNLEFVPFWWSKLMSNDEFKNKLVKRYKELRKTALSDKNIDKIITNNYNILKPSMEREAIRWRTYINNEGNPHNAKSFEDAVDYLRDWTHKRAEYLDKTWN